MNQLQQEIVKFILFYTFTFDAPKNGDTKDFVTRHKISDTNHAHIKITNNPKYKLNAVLIKGYGGKKISGVKIIKGNSSGTLYINEINNYKKGSKVSARLKNNTNIDQIIRFKGEINYH